MHGQEKTEEEILTRAEDGDLDAMVQLASLLGEEDEDAELWLTRAAEKGHVPALSKLGILYIKREDYENAIKYLRLAAEEGDLNAMSNLGVLLKKQGMRGQAENWLRLAAVQGHDVAMVNLAGYFLDINEEEEATKWLEKAAELGNIDALMTLGNRYFKVKDYSKAREYYRRGAELGSKKALLAEGESYLAENDLASAEQFFRDNLDRGDEFRVNYSQILIKRGDLEGAEKVFEEMIRDDSADGYFYLGLLRQSQGNIGLAIRLYEEAGRRGNLLATHNRGLLLEAEDKEMAKQLYRRALGGGLLQSSINLALLLEEEGKIEEAIEVYETAAKSGYAPAIESLIEIYGELGRDEDASVWKRKLEVFRKLTSE